MRYILMTLLTAVGMATHAADGTKLDLGAPLRDPQIAYDAESQTYYLTGTTRINSLDPRYADFQNNDGVRLWKSPDLKTWTEVGLVWDLSKVERHGHYTAKGDWQRHLRTVPDRPDKEWSRGVTAPELHRIENHWWIVFALNDQEIGLLQSSSGKPEGPYEEIGRIGNSALGGDGSLFEDADPADGGAGNNVYLVWGGGYIARLKDDMSDVAERGHALQMTIEGYPTQAAAPNQHGERGAFVFKENDRYCFIYSAWTKRNGKGCFDTMIAEGESLLGPYARPRPLVPDGGQAAVFKDAAGMFHVVYSVDGQVMMNDFTP